MAEFRQTALADRPTEIIGQSEAEEIYDNPDIEGFDIKVEKEDVRFGHTQSGCRNGRVYDQGRELHIEPKGKRMLAQGVGGNAELVIEPSGFSVEIFAPISLPNIDQLDYINEIRQLNSPIAINSFVHTPDVDGAQLANNAVPPKGTVLIQADPSNADDMLVGDSNGQNHVLTPGASINFDVNNTDAIYVTDSTAGDSANVTHEQ